MRSLILSFLLYSPLLLLANKFQDQYFPIKLGDVQEYSFVTERILYMPNSETHQDKIEGISVQAVQANPFAQMKGQHTFLIRELIVRKSADSDKTSKESIDNIVALDNSQFTILASMPSGQTPAQGRIHNPPALVMDFNKMSADQPFTTVKVEDGVRSNLQTSKYRKNETIDTPLGHFTNVFMCEMKGSVTGEVQIGELSSTIENGVINQTTWLAPGVGVVQEEWKIDMSMIVNGQSIRMLERTVRKITKSE